MYARNFTAFNASTVAKINMNDVFKKKKNNGMADIKMTKIVNSLFALLFCSGHVISVTPLLFKF